MQNLVAIGVSRTLASRPPGRFMGSRPSSLTHVDAEAIEHRPETGYDNGARALNGSEPMTSRFTDDVERDRHAGDRT